MAIPADVNERKGFILRAKCLTMQTQYYIVRKLFASKLNFTG